jgi:hypothetical protein
VSKEVERIEAEEAAIRAAELAEEEARLAAEAAGEEYVPGSAAAAPAYAAPAYAAPSYSAPSYSAPAPKAATGAEARVLAAIKSSPLMLELGPGAPGVAALAKLDDAMINAACVLLMRVEGFGDAKALIQQDASVRSRLGVSKLLCSLQLTGSCGVAPPAAIGLVQPRPLYTGALCSSLVALIALFASPATCRLHSLL